VKRLESGNHPNDDELRRLFAQGPDEFGPVALWWWSGGRVTREGMTPQLEKMARGGLRNLMIVNLAPCGTIYGSAPDDPPFLSEPWWDLFAFLVEEGKRLGIRIWFYDQLGFSGASLQAGLVTQTPDFQGLRLVRAMEDVRGPQEISLPAPPLGTPLAAFVARIADRSQLADEPCSIGTALREVKDVSDCICGDVLKVQVPEGQHRVMIFATVFAGFDYQSPKACAALINILHGQMEKRFGRDLGISIIGSFQDEFPALPRFSKRLPEEFRNRTGYDILDYLPSLFDNVVDRFGRSDGPTSVQVRCDAARVAAELCEEAFFIPLAAWHKKHDMLCGIDQTIRDGDPIRASNYYVDYFRTHRHFSAPGNEQGGDAKPHQSLADLYGHPRVWMEGYHSSGWGQTLEDIVTLLHPWMVDGSTLYNPHAIYYSTHGSYWEWAPPDNGWRQPYFVHYPELADYVSRLCYLLSRGDRVVHTAILHPASTVHACSGWGEEGEAAKEANRAYWDCLNGLRESRHDCLIMDEESVQRAEVREGAMCVRALTIRSIALPGCCVLEGNTLTRLVEFAEAGGRVLLIGDVPRIAGDGALNGEQFEQLAARLIASAERHPGGADAARALVDRPVAAAGSGPLPCLQRRIGERNFFFILSDSTISASGAALREVNQFDRSTTLAGRGGRLSVTFAADGIPECWSAQTGAVIPVLNYRRSENSHKTQVEVELEDTPAPLLALRPPLAGEPLAIESDLRIVSCERTGDEARIIGYPRLDKSEPGRAEHRVRVEYADAVFESAVPAAPAKFTFLSEPFDCRLEMTCANDDGSFAWPPSNGPIPVEHRTFRFREETPGLDSREWAKPEFDDGDWETVLASFGPRAESCGPVPLSGGQSSEDVAFSHLPEMPWIPCVYSERLGIENDRVFSSALGGKGRIPEEFIDLGDGKPEELYRVRTVVTSPEGPLRSLLRIGGPVRKRVFLNGEEIALCGPSDRQKFHASVHLMQGNNQLEILMERSSPGPLRLFYQFLPKKTDLVEPEWIWYSDARQSGTVRFAKTFELATAAASAVVAVALANLKHRVRVNGKIVGERGGFDPYFTSRADRYDILEQLVPGENRFEVDVIYPGDPVGLEAEPAVGLLVDGLITLQSGREVTLVSDESFGTVAVDGDGRNCDAAKPARILPGPQPGYFGDPANLLVYPRPHPLRFAGWLQDQPPPAPPFDRVVYSTVGSRTKRSWYRFPLPPGSNQIHLAIHGMARFFVDGHEVALESESGTGGKEGGATRLTAGLPYPERPRRMAALRVDPRDGFEKGAAIDAPITFDMGPGRIPLGSWDTLGLPHYSGGVVYSTTFSFQDDVDGQALLDLGKVRGSVDVTVNGVPCGTRLWHPYRFDISNAVQRGENRVEIRVFNTLGPHYGHGHPSAHVFENQTQSGIWGPVSIAICREVSLTLNRA